VHAHPLFQGPFAIKTAIGNLAVDIPGETPDPLGQDRLRNITLVKVDRLGSKNYHGQAMWETQRFEGTTQVIDMGEWRIRSGFSTEGRLVERKHHGEEESRKAGMVMESGVGDIRLFF
jgi:hypothetical protein